jgi:hypothetical protein
MTRQLDNTMIRELSADELLVVSGAQRAQEFKEPTEVKFLGWTFQQNNNTGALCWWGVSLPGRPAEVIYGSD